MAPEYGQFELLFKKHYNTSILLIVSLVLRQIESAFDTFERSDYAWEGYFGASL